MPQLRIQFRAGIDKMATATLNRGGWSDGNLVRFRQGVAEKWAGWTKITTTLLTGICRALAAFTTLAGDKVLGVGTHNHFYIYKGSAVTDITPVDRTVALIAGQIATAISSTRITVTSSAAHGLAIGDYFTFDTIAGTGRTPSGITVATIMLTGDYVVDAVASSTVWSFIAASAANANATYGGVATVTAYLPAGSQDFTPGLGWGAGGWGISAWGTPSTVAANTLPARFWSLAPWGQSLLASPSQAALFVWNPDVNGNVTTRAALVTNGTPANGPPLRIGAALVAMPERHVLLLGCSTLNAFAGYDPMLVRWCDVEDYTTWNPTNTNSAGSFRIQGGTSLVAGWNTTLQTLIWSDTHLHVCRFLGLPYVYGFTMLGQDCGLVGPKAFASIGGVVYWMSARNFYRYTGGAPEQLMCPFIETVFSTITPSQAAKVTAGVNNTTGEVLWFYPANGSLEPSVYITYSQAENAWTGGTLQRCVWLDSDLFSGPVAVNSSGQIYQHENGTDADGAALGDFITSAYMDMSDGEQIMLLTQIAPDFNFQAGNVNVTFLTKDWPNSPIRTRGPYLMTPTTTTRGFRARGRQMAMRIESVGVGSNWRMGAIRVNSQADGMR